MTINKKTDINKHKQKDKKRTLKCKNTPLKTSFTASKSKVLNVLERVFSINNKGVSEFIYINEEYLTKKGCNHYEVNLFKSNNGVAYLRRDSPICRKYMIQRKYNTKTGALIGFKLIGFNKQVFFSRHISQQIRLEILNKYNNKCVWCGSRDRLEIDHKNGRYNVKTDKIDDFQLLCKICNDKKRQRCNKCRETGKRYNVQKEISSVLYKSAFTSGYEKYTEKQGCKGCFLYDIEDFYMNHDRKCNKKCCSVKHQHVLCRK